MSRVLSSSLEGSFFATAAAESRLAGATTAVLAGDLDTTGGAEPQAETSAKEVKDVQTNKIFFTL